MHSRWCSTEQSSLEVFGVSTVNYYNCRNILWSGLWVAPCLQLHSLSFKSILPKVALVAIQFATKSAPFGVYKSFWNVIKYFLHRCALTGTFRILKLLWCRHLHLQFSAWRLLLFQGYWLYDINRCDDEVLNGYQYQRATLVYHNLQGASSIGWPIRSQVLGTCPPM